MRKHDGCHINWCFLQTKWYTVISCTIWIAQLPLAKATPNMHCKICFNQLTWQNIYQAIPGSDHWDIHAAPCWMSSMIMCLSAAYRWLTCLLFTGCQLQRQIYFKDLFRDRLNLSVCVSSLLLMQVGQNTQTIMLYIQLHNVKKTDCVFILAHTVLNLFLQR